MKKQIPAGRGGLKEPSVEVGTISSGEASFLYKERNLSHENFNSHVWYRASRRSYRQIQRPVSPHDTGGCRPIVRRAPGFLPHQTQRNPAQRIPTCPVYRNQKNSCSINRISDHRKAPHRGELNRFSFVRCFSVGIATDTRSAPPVLPKESKRPVFFSACKNGVSSWDAVFLLRLFIPPLYGGCCSVCCGRVHAI